MNKEYRKSGNRVHNLNYHIVYCPKFRKKCLVGDVALRWEQSMREKCAELGCDVVALEIMPDHTHLFIAATPDFAPNHIIAQLKGDTSRVLRQEFPMLRQTSATMQKTTLSICMSFWTMLLLKRSMRGRSALTWVSQRLPATAKAISIQATLSSRYVVGFGVSVVCFTCSRCGYCDKGHRKSQDKFLCLKCGFELNADFNAAINIGARADSSDGLLCRSKGSSHDQAQAPCL
jgi:putative transposase